MPSRVQPHTSRTSSFTRVALPKVLRAATRASSELRPFCACSSAAASSHESSARPMSASRSFRDRQRMSCPLFFSRPHDPGDGARHTLPFRFLHGQLLLSRGRKPVVFVLPLLILCGRLPFG